MTLFLCTVWVLLMGFGVISIFEPAWLKDLSSVGKMYESRDYRDYGDTYFRKKDYQRAIVNYKQALAIKPDIPSAQVNMAISYGYLGQTAIAEQLLLKVLETPTTQRGVVFFQLAQLSEKQKRDEQAVEWYKSALGTEFPPQTVFDKLGSVYFRLGRFAEAKEAFGNAIRIHEDPASSYRDMLRSNLAIYELEYDEYIPELQRQLAKNITADSLSQYDMEIIRTVLARDPVLSDTYANLGIACASLGELDLATTYLDRSLQIWPDNVQARKNKEVLRQLKASQKAAPK